MRIYSNFVSQARAEWEYGETCEDDCECRECRAERLKEKEDQLEDECGEVDEEVAEPWGCSDEQE